MDGGGGGGHDGRGSGGVRSRPGKGPQAVSLPLPPATDAAGRRQATAGAEAVAALAVEVEAEAQRRGAATTEDEGGRPDVGGTASAVNPRAHTLAENDGAGGARGGGGGSSLPPSSSSSSSSSSSTFLPSPTERSVPPEEQLVPRARPCAECLARWKEEAAAEGESEVLLSPQGVGGGGSGGGGGGGGAGAGGSRRGRPPPSSASASALGCSRSDERGGAASFTLCDVGLHTTPPDCWIAAKGSVYDVTPFLGSHPGGRASLLRHAGTDSSRDFDFHSESAQARWKKYRVGRLRPCEGHPRAGAEAGGCSIA